MPTDFPSLKSLAIQNINQPVVLKGFITKWSLLNWTLEDWASKFGDKVLPFRVGSINEVTVKGDPIWERNCSTELMTLKEFMKWESGPNGQMRDKWMYFDYKYMHEWFKDDQDFLKAIDWGCLGFYGRTGEESTLWIGCHGSHTPCHADTYGFNLVAQLHGRKRWLLFPPDSQEILDRASRIPYEESSIYINGCIGGGKGGARGVVLSPGEVLVVPRRWWHRVDTEGGISISVNTWVPSEQDNTARLEESLVRFLFASTLESLPIEWHKSFLNPNEDDLPNSFPDDNLSIVKHTLEACVSQFKQIELPQPQQTSAPMTSPGETHIPPLKRLKPNKEGECLQRVEEPMKAHVQVVPLVGCDKWFSWDHIDASPPRDNCDILKRILNAFCHPDVISLVSQKILASSMKNSQAEKVPEELSQIHESPKLTTL